jgi:hypothetical protein
MTKRHSCCACKAWQRYYRGEMEAAVRASMERMMQREIESLRSVEVRSEMVINADASLQGAGISWREQRRAIRTPHRRNRQIHREYVDDFMAQWRHNGWAQSTEDIQRLTMTKRRARR